MLSYVFVSVLLFVFVMLGSTKEHAIQEMKSNQKNATKMKITNDYFNLFTKPI